MGLFHIDKTFICKFHHILRYSFKDNIAYGINKLRVENHRL